jgi:TPR repeat protein
MRTLTFLVVLLASLGPAGTARADECGDAYGNADYGRAAAPCRKAAEQGHAEAQATLGAMYGMGRGVPQDDAEAARWTRKAAEQGHAKAQFSLGLTYLFGTGVPRDHVKAHALFSIAAARGSIRAPDLRAKTATVMTQAEISEAQQMARECAGKDYKGCGF